jgi:type II secretory pathway component GspD/PulD (secretin)
MKSFKVAMVFTLLLASFIAFAEPQCSTIETCINKVSAITKKPYFWSNKRALKDKVVLSNNFKINQNNADSFISRLLFDNGFTRIKYEDGYQIIFSRDIRYNSTPLKTVKELKNLGESDDYVMVSIPVDHIFEASLITRNLRPFMSRYGRVIGNDEGKKIILQDTVNNSKRLVKLINKMKRKYSDKEVKEYTKKYNRINKLKQRIKQLEAAKKV